eukprot:TRINITY_DN269_c0_g1_i1.p1 TRINITY_DN269_c0_g1~~TRINITY_DN269_c0_g1_i1.p1  ORF type:complete len:270 (+),score=33.79 TRINITY_DN269_c0_g1_i1:145-954(+)
MAEAPITVNPYYRTTGYKPSEAATKEFPVPGITTSPKPHLDDHPAEAVEEELHNVSLEAPEEEYENEYEEEVPEPIASPPLTERQPVKTRSPSPLPIAPTDPFQEIDLSQNCTYDDDIEAQAPEANASASGPTGIVDYSASSSTLHLPVPIVCFIAYGFFLLGGFVVGLAERRSFFASFHAWQSVMINLVFAPGFVACVIIDISTALTMDIWGLTIIWAILFVLTVIVCFVGSLARWRSGGDGLFKLPLVGSVALRITERIFNNQEPDL